RCLPFRREFLYDPRHHLTPSDVSPVAFEKRMAAAWLGAAAQDRRRAWRPPALPPRDLPAPSVQQPSSHVGGLRDAPPQYAADSERVRFSTGTQAPCVPQLRAACTASSVRPRWSASRIVSGGSSARSGEVRSVYVKRTWTFIHPLSVSIAWSTAGRPSRTPSSVNWNR